MKATLSLMMSLTWTITVRSPILYNFYFYGMSESDKENEKVEEVERNEHFEEDDEDIREAYEQLFHKSPKVNKLIESSLRRLMNLSLRKKDLYLTFNSLLNALVS